jgi:chaperonin cofactor prefoldin
VNAPNIDEHRLKKIIHNAKKLRHEYSELTPQQLGDKHDISKWRKNWHNSVGLVLMRMCRKGELDEELLDKYEHYEKRLKRLQNQELTTQEDIDQGNRMLDELIRYCEQRLKAARKAA